MYKAFLKRVFDFLLAFWALVFLSPVLLVLAACGAVAMKGNPFFLQTRPGRISKKTGKERLFRLVKFRTMTNKKDQNGTLLPDDKRLTGYGAFLRSTSLDELPELFNILKGDMSLVGPRPLLVKYLPLYSKEQRRRHNVRPGLTGLAQVKGRNAISWDERFAYDIEYVESISLLGDIKIVFATIKSVLFREGISSDTCATMEEFTGNSRKEEVKI